MNMVGSDWAILVDVDDDHISESVMVLYSDWMFLLNLTHHLPTNHDRINVACGLWFMDHI